MAKSPSRLSVKTRATPTRTARLRAGLTPPPETLLTLTSAIPFTLDPGGILHAAPGFGIREDGSCYYNPDGAAGGEAAQLRLDEYGNPVLVQPWDSYGDMLTRDPAHEKAQRLRARNARLSCTPHRRPTQGLSPQEARVCGQQLRARNAALTTRGAR
jgi:hypothetical protein